MKPESKIQADIVAYLQSQKILCFSVPNELAGNNARAMRFAITMGLRPGAPDLVVLYPPGAVTFMEVKTSTGRQSENQKTFQDIAQRHGIRYYVVRSVEDVVDIIERRV